MMVVIVVLAMVGNDVFVKSSRSKLVTGSMNSL